MPSSTQRPKELFSLIIGLNSYWLTWLGFQNFLDLYGGATRLFPLIQPYPRTLCSKMSSVVSLVSCNSMELGLVKTPPEEKTLRYDQIYNKSQKVLQSLVLSGDRESAKRSWNTQLFMNTGHFLPDISQHLTQHPFDLKCPLHSWFWKCQMQGRLNKSWHLLLQRNLTISTSL